VWKLPKPQGLHQRDERDCSVSVFAALTGLSEDQVRAEMPSAELGEVTVAEWMAWLESNGFTVTKHQGCPTDIGPCAHLVAQRPQSNRDFHWIYRDEEGDVFDPSPVFMFMPADDERMRSLSLYSVHVLTLTVQRTTGASESPAIASAS
jgi:hypothetical protein